MAKIISSSTYIAPVNATDLATKGYVDASSVGTLTTVGITYNATDYFIKADTSDGSDSKRILLQGGGGTASGRGAYIGIYGNDYSGGEGTLEIYGGDASTGSGNVNIGTRSTTGELRFSINSSIVGRFYTNGYLGVNHATPAFQLDVVSGSGNNAIRLAANAAGSTTLRLDTFNDVAETANNKNWAFRNRYNEFGTLELMRSTTSTGDPLTTVMSFQKDSTIRFFGTLTPNADNAFNIGTSTISVSSIYSRSLGTGTNNTLSFFTNSILRWNVDTDGNFAPDQDNTVGIGTTSRHSAATYTYQVGTGNSNDFILFTANTTRWRLRTGGTLNPNGNNLYDLGESANRISTIYSVNALNTSDERVKHDIVSIDSTNALAKVVALNPINFKLIPEYDTSDRLRAGFKAQEVIEEIPEAVIAGDSDPFKAYGDEGFETWSMQSDHIIPYLVGAIQKLKEEIDSLKVRVAILEG